MRSLLPSLAAIRAFETASRFESFSRAAEELNLTQSAISQQIRQLESFLGVDLFQRTGKRVVLTEAGARYLADVLPALDRVEDATARLLTSGQVGGVINFGVLPTFCARWLLPRLPRFLARHPDVVINFTSRIYPFDFGAVDLDAAMHYGEGVWPGARAELLMDEDMVAVCSPSLLAGMARAEVLAKCTLLQHTTRPLGWQEWLHQAGFNHIDGRRGPKLDQFSMAIEAAKAGLGATLLPRFLIEDELASGALVMPVDVSVRSRSSYWLVYPEAKSQNPTLSAFRTWLLAEAQLVLKAA